MYLFDSIFDMSNYFNIHFNPSGVFNNKNSWISDDSKIKIIWDETLNAWKLSGSTLGNVQVINTNPAYPPINNNWKVLGSTHVVKSATQGACQPIILALTYNYDSNNPGCKCDGSINITATGGVPPYQYSYDEGVTYISSPIKTGLCGGTYITSVKDSVGTVVQDGVVTLSAVKPKTTYTMNLNDGGSSYPGGNVTNQKYTITVTPMLPNGVTINFGLNFSSVFQRTPYANSANSSYVVQLKKNNNIITTFINNTTETTSGNSTRPGCQNYLIYHTNYDYVYDNLTYTNTDVYEITVIYDYELTCANTPPITNELSVNDENSIGPLGIDLEDNSYYRCCSAYFPIESSPQLSNVSITGCDCCLVETWVYYYVRK